MKIVFAHGFCESAMMWQGFADQICDHKDAVLIDLPGFGNNESECLESIDAMAEWVHDELSRSEEQLVWVGHSMGGYVGAAFARKYPERLKALIMVHSSFRTDTESKKAERKKSIQFVEKHGSAVFLAQFVTRLFRHDHPPNENLMQRARILVEPTEAKSIIQANMAMMHRCDHTEWLKTNHIPICMIVGRYDAHLELQDQLSQAALIKRGSVHLLEESGHMGLWEEPERCAAAIRNFLEHHLG